MRYEDTPLKRPPTEQIVERLEQGLARLTKGWAQDVLACNADGDQVGPEDKGATCWCMLGALTSRDLGPYEDAPRSYARRELANTLMDQTPEYRDFDEDTREDKRLDLEFISEWNDDRNRTRAQVIKLFQDTIDRLRASLQVPSPP